MPVIWGTHDKSDIFIDVAIIDASTINLTTSPPIGGTIPTPTLFKALLDTGAQKTMISPKVINTLNLRPLGKILISGVGVSRRVCCRGHFTWSGISARLCRSVACEYFKRPSLWSRNSILWRSV